MKRVFLIILAALLLMAAAAVAFAIYSDKRPKYQADQADFSGLAAARFNPVEIDFAHRYSLWRGLPYAGAAVLDIDADGREELFVGGGLRQADGLFVFQGDHFVNVADQAGLVKLGGGLTLGAAVIDCDDNGYEDLLVSRENGVWLYTNQGGRFEMTRLDLGLPPQAFPLGAVITDLNRDGHFDFFLPLVRKAPPPAWLLGEYSGEPVPPRLYINNGDNTFYEMGAGAGLEGLGETFQAAWVDLDDDGLEDLVALQTDGRLSTWKNGGDLLFIQKSHYHSSLKGDYQGLAVGDYDGDGRVDLMLTNRGGSIPPGLLELAGSRRANAYTDWVLMNNSGFFSFRKDGGRAHLAAYELGRGAVFSDFNSDGRLDLAVAQNHPGWPLYLLEPFRLSGKFLLQNSARVFVSAGEAAEVENSGFGVTPLVADFNQDGRPDLVHINIGGAPKVFLSTGGRNHYLNVRLPRRAASFGAIVTVTTLDGTRKQHYPAAAGLSSVSSGLLFFGLGQDKAVEVTVDFPGGGHDQTSGVLYNTTINFD